MVTKVKKNSPSLEEFDAAVEALGVPEDIALATRDIRVYGRDRLAVRNRAGIDMDRLSLHLRRIDSEIVRARIASKKEVA